MNCYSMGIDVGSTTVKVVLVDQNGGVVFSRYNRHHAKTQQTLLEILKEARQQVGACRLMCAITGSGGMGLGKALDIPFIQEVEAVVVPHMVGYP